MSATMSEHEFRRRFADAEDRAVLGYPHVDDDEAERVLGDDAMLRATYDSWVRAQVEQPPQPRRGTDDLFRAGPSSAPGYFEGQTTRGPGGGGYGGGLGRMSAGRSYGGGRNTVVGLVLGLVGCLVGPFLFAGGIILGSWGLRRALAVRRTEPRRALVFWAIVASSASLVIAIASFAVRLSGSGLLG